MATAINRAPRVDEIKLETNVPQTFALKYATGKAVGQWGNIMFTAVDDRRLFLNAEDASEFEHALLDLRYKPEDYIRVTRVKHGSTRGGGFAIRVERVDDASAPDEAGDRKTIALLEKSVELAKARSTAAVRKLETAAIPPPGRQAAPEPAPVSQQPNVAPEMPAKGTFAKLLAGALCASMDAYEIAGAYAQSKGFAFDYGSEDVRCSATTLLIEYFKREGR